MVDMKFPGSVEFNEELKKFLGKEVVVLDTMGEKYEGVLRGISALHLNVVIMTDREKVLVKNIVSISRARDLKWVKK